MNLKRSGEPRDFSEWRRSFLRNIESFEFLEDHISSRKRRVMRRFFAVSSTNQFEHKYRRIKSSLKGHCEIFSSELVSRSRLNFSPRLIMNNEQPIAIIFSSFVKISVAGLKHQSTAVNQSQMSHRMTCYIKLKLH